MSALVYNLTASLLPVVATTNSSVPGNKIKLSACKWILYGTINQSGIRFFDILLLIPNVLFLIFLMYGLGVAHVRLHRIQCPIVKTVFSMVFLVSTVGIVRCFVSMFLTSTFSKHHKVALPTKILWLLLRCFLLAVELSVIIFGLWAGNMRDSRKGVRRVLCVTSILAIVYSSTQATLEIACPEMKGIYGGKYDLYGHGGLLFWSSTSIFFALVYFAIVILPYTKLNECCVLPVRRSFYVYCGLLSVINILQGTGILCLYYKKPGGLCIVDVTMFVYYAVFAPMVYWTFLSDFFKSMLQYHSLTVDSTYSYQPIPESGTENSSNFFE